jgi:hypothetical protein
VNKQNTATMRYERQDGNPHYWVVVVRDDRELCRFPYENMRHYTFLYAVPDDAREFIMFWAKMLVSPD